MSKKLEEYGAQKSTSITTAKRLTEVGLDKFFFKFIFLSFLAKV